MWDHGVDERLVEGFPIRQLLRIHHHAHALHLLLAHLHGHLRSPELLLLYGFQLLYLGLLARDDVPGELDDFLVLGVLKGDFGHRYGSLMVGDHRVDEALVGVFAVLHDHLPRHAPGAHTHRAVAHLVVVHPGHTATFIGLAQLAIAAGSATLLATAGAPTGGQDEG